MSFTFTFLAVTYISSSNSPPTRYLITLCKVSYVSDLKVALCKVAGLDSPEHLVVAEVFDNHIARIVVRIMLRVCSKWFYLFIYLFIYLLLLLLFIYYYYYYYLFIIIIIYLFIFFFFKFNCLLPHYTVEKKRKRKLIPLLLPFFFFPAGGRVHD